LFSAVNVYVFYEQINDDDDELLAAPILFSLLLHLSTDRIGFEFV